MKYIKLYRAIGKPELLSLQTGMNQSRLRMKNVGSKHVALKGKLGWISSSRRDLEVRRLAVVRGMVQWRADTGAVQHRDQFPDWNAEMVHQLLPLTVHPAHVLPIVSEVLKDTH